MRNKFFCYWHNFARPAGSIRSLNASAKEPYSSVPILIFILNSVILKKLYKLNTTLGSGLFLSSSTTRYPKSNYSCNFLDNKISNLNPLGPSLLYSYLAFRSSVYPFTKVVNVIKLYWFSAIFCFSSSLSSNTIWRLYGFFFFCL